MSGMTSCKTCTNTFYRNETCLIPRTPGRRRWIASLTRPHWRLSNRGRASYRKTLLRSGHAGLPFSQQMRSSGCWEMCAQAHHLTFIYATSQTFTNSLMHGSWKCAMTLIIIGCVTTNFAVFCTLIMMAFGMRPMSNGMPQSGFHGAFNVDTVNLTKRTQMHELKTTCEPWNAEQNRCYSVATCLLNSGHCAPTKVLGLMHGFRTTNAVATVMTFCP